MLPLRGLQHILLFGLNTCQLSIHSVALPPLLMQLAAPTPRAPGVSESQHPRYGSYGNALVMEPKGVHSPNQATVLSV